jgi:hypothetical protein
MDYEQRFEAALKSAEPGRALRSLVLALSAEGVRKEVIYELCEQLLLRLRAASREAEEESLLDVMDALTGWCHSEARLLPDK